MGGIALILIAGFSIIGWIIESELKKLREVLTKSLSEQLHSTEVLRQALIGHEQADKMIDETNKLGFDMPADLIAYAEHSRYIQRIVGALDRVDSKLERLNSNLEAYTQPKTGSEN